MNYISSLVFVLCTLLLSAASSAGVAVIVHPSNASGMSTEEVADLFLGKSSKFPDGSTAVPVDQNDESEVKAGFYDKATGKDLSQLNAYWSRLIFTGKGKPPKSVDDGYEVLELISANPNMIGYVDSSEVTAAVKVLITLD